MKALVISDDDLIIQSIDSCLKKYGIDTINYKWLLKALDNVEEICPDLTVISAIDYPRHWKTFTQFIRSGIGENKSEVILYDGGNFSEDDKKKADALGVFGIFQNFEENEAEGSLSFLLKRLTGKEENFTVFAVPENEKSVSKDFKKINKEYENCTIPSVDEIANDGNSKANEKNEVLNENSSTESENSAVSNAPFEKKCFEKAKIPSVDEILFENNTFVNENDESSAEKNVVSEDEIETEARISEKNYDNVVIPSVDEICCDGETVQVEEKKSEETSISLNEKHEKEVFENASIPSVDEIALTESNEEKVFEKARDEKSFDPEAEEKSKIEKTYENAAIPEVDEIAVLNVKTIDPENNIDSDSIDSNELSKTISEDVAEETSINEEPSEVFSENVMDEVSNKEENAEESVVNPTDEVKVENSVMDSENPSEAESLSDEKASEEKSILENNDHIIPGKSLLLRIKELYEKEQG